MRALRNEALMPVVSPILRPIASIVTRPWSLRTIASRILVLLPALAAFSIVATVHGILRGYALNVAPIDPLNLAEWDIAVFQGLPSVWMQDLLGTEGFWADLAFFYWSSFFWLPMLLFGVVVLTRGTHVFLRLLLLQTALVLSADVIFALAPTRPPWMDAELVRIVAVQSENGVHIDRNQFAALPSLHVAIPMALALWLNGLERSDSLRRIGPIAFAWALGMGWSVIYTGEHYVFDVVAGYAWAGLVFILLRRLLYAGRDAQLETERAEPLSLAGREQCEAALAPNTEQAA